MHRKALLVVLLVIAIVIFSMVVVYSTFNPKDPSDSVLFNEDLPEHIRAPGAGGVPERVDGENMYPGPDGFPEGNSPNKLDFDEPVDNTPPGNEPIDGQVKVP